MKDRRPRKAKKIAKKKKSKVDALVMMQAALTTALHVSQLAIINSTPIMFSEAAKIEKSIRVVTHTVESARAISNVMKQIKPWRTYV